MAFSSCSQNEFAEQMLFRRIYTTELPTDSFTGLPPEGKLSYTTNTKVFFDN